MIFSTHPLHFLVFITVLLCRFFFFLLSIGFIPVFFWGKFNSSGPQNLLSIFFYYVSFVFSIVLMHANDFIIFVISMELVTIPVYLIAISNSKTQSVLGAFKYLIVNTVGTLLICTGLAFGTYTLGVSTFTDLVIFFSVPQFSTHEIQIGYYLFNVFFWSGIALKFGLYPFHFWIFDAYKNFSKLSLILLAVNSKIPFFPILFFVAHQIKNLTFLGEFFLIFPVLSVLYGSFAAAYYTYKRRITFRSLIAYSSIHNFGLIFFFLFAHPNFSFAYYTGIYSLTAVFMFVTFFDLAKNDESSSGNLAEIQTFNNFFSSQFYQAHRSSYQFFLFSILFVSGLPPFGIFFPKFSLFFRTLTNNFTNGAYVFFLLTILATFVMAYSYIHFAFRSFFINPSQVSDSFITDQNNERKSEEKIRTGILLFTIGVLGVFSVLIFFLWVFSS